MKRFVTLTILLTFALLFSGCAGLSSEGRGIKFKSAEVPKFRANSDHIVTVETPIDNEHTVASRYTVHVSVDPSGTQTWNVIGDETALTMGALVVDKAGNILSNSLPAAISGYFNVKASEKLAEGYKNSGSSASYTFNVSGGESSSSALALSQQKLSSQQIQAQGTDVSF